MVEQMQCMRVDQQICQIVPELPAVVVNAHGLLVDGDGGVEPPQQVEAASDLLQVGGVARVQGSARLEVLERLADVALAPGDQSLNEDGRLPIACTSWSIAVLDSFQVSLSRPDRELTLPVGGLQLLLDEGSALLELAQGEELVDLPVGLVSHRLVRLWTAHLTTRGAYKS